jgi:hypothetical protein
VDEDKAAVLVIVNPLILPKGVLSFSSLKEDLLAFFCGLDKVFVSDEIFSEHNQAVFIKLVDNLSTGNLLCLGIFVCDLSHFFHTFLIEPLDFCLLRFFFLLVTALRRFF